MRVTDFASLRLTDFASKQKTPCKKSVATDTNITKASSLRSVKAKTPKQDCVLERHTWTCPLCDKVIETCGKLRAMTRARYRRLSTRHQDVDAKNVARLRRPAEPICHVSYDFSDNATAWRCPWCPARLPFLSAPAKALAVRLHCKGECGETPAHSISECLLLLRDYWRSIWDRGRPDLEETIRQMTRYLDHVKGPHHGSRSLSETFLQVHRSKKVEVQDPQVGPGGATIYIYIFINICYIYIDTNINIYI